MKDMVDSKTCIIIPCKNEGIYMKQTVDFMHQTEARELAKIIVVDDNSNDGCCNFIKSQPNRYMNVKLIQTKGIGAARARNLGASLAVNAEVLVFCDAHITMKNNWLKVMLNSLNNEDTSTVCPGISDFNPNSPIGYGQTFDDKFQVCWMKKPKDTVEIPLAPGGCMAIKRDVFDSVGGFDNGFRSWGYEDVELSIKLWLFGHKIYVNPSARVGHKFRKVQPYVVDSTEYHYNRLRMAYSHFNQNRVDKLINMMKDYPNHNEIMNKIINSDTLKQREDYFKNRLYDDCWFFNKFNIHF